MQTAATCGVVGSPGSGRRALAARLRTLPGVSAPSSVVRSTIEIAVSMAQALAVVLIDRVPSTPTRASAPTWSTPGRPCRKARKAASERVTSRYGAGGSRRGGIAAAGASGSSTWVMPAFSPAPVRGGRRSPGQVLRQVHELQARTHLLARGLHVAVPAVEPQVRDAAGAGEQGRAGQS